MFSIAQCSQLPTGRVDTVAFPDVPALVKQANPVYTDLTCANRCCKKAVVNADPATVADCATNWRACAVLDSQSALDRCRPSVGTMPWKPCTVWVPCDKQDVTVFMVNLLILLISAIVVVAVLFALNFSRTWFSLESLISSAPAVLWLAITVATAFLAMFSAYDYKSWLSSIEVDSEVVSMQACFDLNSPSTTCRKDGVDIMRGIQSYLLVRANLDSVVHLVLSLCYWIPLVRENLPIPKFIYLAFICIMHLAFFVCDCVFLSYTENQNTGLKAIDGYAQGTPSHVTLEALMAILLVFDFLGALFMGWHTYSSITAPANGDSGSTSDSQPLLTVGQNGDGGEIQPARSMFSTIKRSHLMQAAFKRSIP